MYVVNVPIAKAVLFIPPDGTERDPDLSSKTDRAGLSTIAAQGYNQARAGRDKPDWVTGPHRLYCPCCLDLQAHTVGTASALDHVVVV